MKMFVQLVFVSLGLGLAACGDGPTRQTRSSRPSDGGSQSTLAGSADNLDTSTDASSSETATTGIVPSSLSCVSGASSQDGEQVPSVWRLQVAIDGEDANIVVQRGPQFLSHNGQWFESQAEDDTRTAKVTSGDIVQIRERQGPYGLRLTLERDGLFFVGSMADHQCYESIEDFSQSDASITCWNESEVFGSPWTGEPGAFSARFQWDTGKCMDTAGRDALNDVPIEFVRETGYGECADLRGVALNGDDLSSPDLQYWFLAGADLSGATLYFANLTSATLNGAHLAGLQFGYATVSGSVDDFTELPSGASCEAVESPWVGSSITCMQ